MKNIVQERMNKAMNVLGVSKSELSRRTGISNSSISEYLSGKYSLKQDKIYLIATALNVSPAWLMGFGDTPAIFKEDSNDEYYEDPTVNAYAEQLRTNPNMRLLFDATKDMTKEDIDYVVDLVNRLKNK